MEQRNEARDRSNRPIKAGPPKRNRWPSFIQTASSMHAQFGPSMSCSVPALSGRVLRSRASVAVFQRGLVSSQRPPANAGAVWGESNRQLSQR